MSDKKLTAEQQNDLTQKIWSLRNKMAEQMEQLEALHAKQLPSVEDGIAALYTVHRAWVSDEYDALEKLIKHLE